MTMTPRQTIEHALDEAILTINRMKQRLLHVQYNHDRLWDKFADARKAADELEAKANANENEGGAA